MDDVVHAGHHGGGHARIRDVAFDEFHAGTQVALVAGHEIVGDADTVAAGDERF